jgi:hypothetical protein
MVKGLAADATDAPQPWGLLCNPVMKMINFSVFPSNGAPVEWNWQGKTEVVGENPVPMSLCTPQVPHGLTRHRTRVSAVRGLSHGTAKFVILRLEQVRSYRLQGKHCVGQLLFKTLHETSFKFQLLQACAKTSTLTKVNGKYQFCLQIALHNLVRREYEHLRGRK